MTVEHIEARMRRILTQKPDSSVSELTACLKLLIEEPVSDAQLDLVERYLTGELVSGSPLSPVEDNALMGDSGWWSLISLLCDRNRLTYDLFKRSLWRASRAAYLLGGRRQIGTSLDQAWDRLFN